MSNYQILSGLGLFFLLSFPVFSQYNYTNFNSGNLSDWDGGVYTITLSNQSLRIVASDVGNSYEAMVYNFEEFNLSANPIVRLKIKTSSPVDVRIDVKDINWHVSNTVSVTHHITEDHFQLYTYDFSGKFSQSYPDAQIVDSTRINGILVYLNPGGPPYSGTLHFDDLLIGKPFGAAIALTGDENFGQVLPGNTQTNEMTITNIGGSTLSVSSITLPAGFTSDFVPGTIAPDSALTFMVTFTPVNETNYTGLLIIGSDATLGNNIMQLSAAGGLNEIPADFSDRIHINQIGYYPDLEKLGVVIDGTEEMVFRIWPASLDTILYEDTLSAPMYWDKSEEYVSIADFTDFTMEGQFVLEVPEIGRSYPFVISTARMDDVLRASLKSYFYNRASTALTPEFAGIWARDEGHPDTAVKIHASAASAARPENYIISSPKGWYDAGDFGKYVVNGGISVHTLLAAYEAFRPYFNGITVHIPESANGIPDILDEVMWELDWMLTMQDPNDGGVYHKLTTSEFEGFVMPADATNDRYVYYKSTAAALNFAAVMAQASRVYKDIDSSKASTFLTSAINAWNWSLNNPARYYIQSDINDMYDPDVNTGEYGDGNVDDEFTWAAAELYITTLDNSYLEHANFTADLTTPNWWTTGFLGYASILNNRYHLTDAISMTGIIDHVMDLADSLIYIREASPYKISTTTFYWGSNSFDENEGMVLMYAYLITGEERYLNGVISDLDYVLGRNAVNYSFLTGFGSNRVMNVHHRASIADGIVDPVPGFVVAGPHENWWRYDFCSPTDFGDIPAKTFQDVVCAPNMTEVTINWGAPFVFLTGALEYLTQRDQYEVTAPTRLTAFVQSDSSVYLTWTDHSTNEEYFIVERSLSPAGPFAQIVTLNQNITVFTDSLDLAPNTPYYYRIKAVNTSLNPGYSNVEEVNILSGISGEISLTSNLRYYPNPTHRYVYLKDATAEDVVVFNMTGQQIRTIIAQDNGTVVIDMIHADKGLYFIRIHDANTYRLIKIVKL